MNKLKMQSLGVVASNVEKIARLFPHCVTERLNKDGKPELAIDFEKLQAELSNDIIAEGEERYQFTWPDKRAAIRLANTPTTMTLRPCREDSVDFDNTQNLYIEGDNLDVLKVLRETYLGKVKVIYIDPPYNTGNDFVYNDDFSQSKIEHEQASGLFDEEGNLSVDFMQRNTANNGRFHTDWLNMMYPRLRLASNLLRDDGVIFISIDDNEVANLRKICDEVFGKVNFVAQFIVVRSEGGGLAKQAVIGHDYCLVYAKSITDFIPLGRPKDIRGEIVSINDEEYWIETDWLRKEFGKYGTCPYEEIVRYLGPKKKEEIDKGIAENQYVLIDKGGFHIVGRYRKVSTDTSKFYTILKHLNKNGVNDLKELNLSQFFDYPKPLSLGIELIQGATFFDKKERPIILDFFSGSGTTAHAVMQLNAEDGGNRQFIMVQLPELCDEKTAAYQAGCKNICEIGKERIRRAGRKIREEAGLQSQNLDIGFRVLKLDSSNMEDVYYTPQEFGQQALFNENIKPDRSNEDLLFQVMLDLGIELSAKIEARQIAGKTVHFVDNNYLVACFDSNVNETTITEIAQQHPVYFVMRDASAANDNVIDNFEQIFKHFSPDTTCKII